jgi:polyphosphate glucokinase
MEVLDMARRTSPPRRVLVLDIGGTGVKMLVTGARQRRRIESGPTMTPRRMVREVLAACSDWRFDAVSIGYPGPVRRGRPVTDPPNLGPGWRRFDFEKAFGRPVRIVNDAAMQALGSYDGGTMLFLGLGTGLGSAMVVDGTLVPLELAHLPYRRGKSFEEYVGVAALERFGRKRWRRVVAEVVRVLSAAFLPDYVVLGGGNARRMKTLPPGARLGDNANAFKGGFALWQRSGA